MSNEIITPAATVLVIRDGKKGIEVFMVERSNKPPFGNLFVFPGGKIDESDSDPRAHSLCKSISDEAASTLLGINNNGLSYWIACVRECFEEVGILLAEKKDGSKLNLNESEKSKYQQYRNDLLEGKISFYDICELEGLELLTENIAPFSHWITPALEVKRFDTRFFIACLPDNQTGLHDGNELVNSLWISAEEAIKKAYSGEMNMIMPTIKNLEQCIGYSSTHELLMRQQELTNEDIPPILPKFFKEDGNWVGLLPGDEGYDNH
ncbi:MAG: NUDIX hydrolase [Gammaproteobacteria bacterium]|jgi:8-oxo-dGTP pyrophosphatase MutT (NUDIX family)|nr:MAG: NUDIX hydrolase [Gammaproteobacteria bacterium TMED186]|tara:strand:- start:2716 stop:3510 length:795 start_codon:yes stop_codon:yes gene_type:complete